MQTPESFVSTTALSDKKRLLSLDVMRGAIMIFLAAESCLVYQSLQDITTDDFSGAVVRQFFHHPWHGLRFWDLVQPAFMTIAGAALYISFHFKSQNGITWANNFKHVVIRCLKLFACGIALHCVYAGKIVWELWNVLTQLSLTTLIAYLLIKKSISFQVTISLILLVITEILYRKVLLPGYEQPFTEHKNFGAWFDTVLMGKINSDGWVAVNFIPTAAHTIWGVVAGKILLQPISAFSKMRALLSGAVFMLAAGYGIDLMNITPVIKRISTSSFTLVSGGWVIIILAFLYWLTDIRQANKYAWIFVIVGTNAIFIYIFFETVGVQWLNSIVGIFAKGFSGLFAVPEKWQAVFSAFVTLWLEWALCYWLYKRKIFFKL